MEFRTLFIGFVLVGLFAFSLLTFGTNFAANNNANITVLDSPALNNSYVGFQSQLESGQTNAQINSNTFDNSTISEDAAYLPISPIRAVGKVFQGTLNSIYSTTIGLFVEQFNLGEGSGIIITGAIGLILAITIIFLLWRAYKSGD